MLQFLEEWGDENKYLNCKFSRGQTNSIKVKKGSHTSPQVLHFQCLGTIIQSNEEINGEVDYITQAGLMKYRNVLAGLTIENYISNEGKICSSYMTHNFVWCWMLSDIKPTRK